jgi:hypothetical protein
MGEDMSGVKLGDLCAGSGLSARNEKRRLTHIMISDGEDRVESVGSGEVDYQIQCDGAKGLRRWVRRDREQGYSLFGS